jgi:putative redox protein
MPHDITTQWKGNMLLESNNPNGKTLLMETSPEFDGTGTGLSPKALMLSSLAGCTGLDLLSLFKKMRVKLDDIIIKVHGELTEEHPIHYHAVKLDYHFYGKDINEAKVNKAVNLSEERYCGVMEMFRKFSEVTTEIHFHNK